MDVDTLLDDLLDGGLWALAPAGEMADEVYRVEIPIDVVDRTEPEMSRVASKVSAFERKMMAAEARLRRVSTGLTNAGRNLTRYATIPILGIGAAAIKGAISFESAFAGVRKTVDATDRQLARLESGIRRMARSLPATHQEIAAVAEAAGQLGIAVPRILSFTKVMVDLGETTDLTADMAATSAARIANVMKMPQTQFDRLGSTLVDLGNKGAATESEIINTAQRIAAAGRQVGLTVPQVLALGEALSSVGIREEAGGSAISRVLKDMLSAVGLGNRKLTLLADTTRMTREEFQELFYANPAQALNEFVMALGELPRKGGAAVQLLEKFGWNEVRVSNALGSLAGAGDLLTRSLDTGSAAWDKNNALQVEAQKRYRTSESRLRAMWNRLKDVGITIGRDLMPHVIRLAEHIESAVRWFSGLDKSTRDLFIKGALSVAILGPVLSILGKIAGTFAFMLKTARSFAAVGIWKTLTGAGLGSAVGGAGGIAGGLGGAARTAGGAAATGLGGLTAGGAIAITAPTVLIGGIAVGEMINSHRDRIARETIARRGVDTKAGRDARHELQIGPKDVGALNKTIREFRMIRREAGGLTIEQERALNEALRARRSILNEIADLRREETENALRPLRTQINLLEGVNGKLTKNQDRRATLLVLQGKEEKAAKIVAAAVERATKEYQESLGPLGKMRDGFQEWSSAAFGAEDATKENREELRRLARDGLQHLDVLIQAYGNVEAAARQALLAQQAEGWGFEAAGGDSPSSRPKGKRPPKKDRGGRVRLPNAAGSYTFQKGQGSETLDFSGLGGRPRGGPTIQVNVGDVHVSALDFDRDAVDDFADEIAGRIAVKVKDVWGNTP